MKDKNDIFNKQKEKKKINPNLKYAIIAFSVFIIILAAFSAFIFMKGIDFDFNNLVDRKPESTSDETFTDLPLEYSVADLTGKREYFFLLTDNSDYLDVGFIITADFDSKNMTVRTVDVKASGGDGKAYIDIYKQSYIHGLIAALNSDYSASIDKYIICTPTQFKKIISSFGGVTVKVPQNVDFKSESFNLKLSEGTQKLSDDFTYKYLELSDKDEKARIMCDILSSVLTTEYSEKAEALFKVFVNNCTTNISVIDFSNAASVLKTYSNASDKFYPVAAS